MERVLIVAAHPDDEILGVGGTIARHVQAGDAVQALIVAEGATSREGHDPQAVQRLRTAAVEAAKSLGCALPLFGGLPDNRLDSVDLLDVVKVVERTIADFGATIVYTQHHGDLNIDHQIVARATLTACRPLPGSAIKSILAFETPSSTEWMSTMGEVFDPTLFVDIAPFLERKLAALRCYAVEMREFPHPRSLPAVEALARWRGASAGLGAAEAFRVIRQISRSAGR